MWEGKYSTLVGVSLHAINNKQSDNMMQCTASITKQYKQRSLQFNGHDITTLRTR